jgi:hypothetical protein
VGVSDRPDDYPSSSSALAFASRVTTNEKNKNAKRNNSTNSNVQKNVWLFLIINLEHILEFPYGNEERLAVSIMYGTK